MITIKAGLLACCPKGFAFNINHIHRREVHFVENGCIYYQCGSDRIPFSEDVQVYSQDYENACLDRIRGMFSMRVHKISKLERGAVFIVVGGSTVQINYDPRPDLKEYEMCKVLKDK